LEGIALATAGPYSEPWGPDRFGEPCRECGLSWTFSIDEARAIVMDTPDSFAAAIGTADGSEGHPDLGWNIGAYVCHVADNLHIWSQWLAGAADRGEDAVPGYDEVVLAEARLYNRVPVGGALWLLRRATISWNEAVTDALSRRVVLQHATRGPISAEDVVRSNAHDAFHHGWDIGRIVGYPG
jgi:Mycothiol maleylpyruvate isomerase N-terminal domain